MGLPFVYFGFSSPHPSYQGQGGLDCKLDLVWISVTFAGGGTSCICGNMNGVVRAWPSCARSLPADLSRGRLVGAFSFFSMS